MKTQRRSAPASFFAILEKLQEVFKHPPPQKGDSKLTRQPLGLRPTSQPLGAGVA